MSVNNLLNSLDRVRKMGPDRWLACCPAHNDKSRPWRFANFLTVPYCFIASPVVLLTKSLAQLASTCRNCSPKNGAFVPRQKYPFSAREALAALVPETLMVALIGKQMSNGIRNDEKTQQALITAVSRISAAHSCMWRVMR